jgi:hypothetical protein
MQKKITLCCFLLFIIWINLSSEEADEFGFYTENIEASQLKTVEVIFPDPGKHAEGEYHYIIK